MTTAVTVTQLRNLADRAAGGLTPDEQQRLRDGIDQLASATDGELRRQLAAAITALGKSETELAGVRTLRDRWVKAGPPPLGQPVSRWWDRRLAELGAALDARPANGTTRQAHVTITNPDEYTANRAALSLVDWINAEFPGHHVTTDAREWEQPDPG